MCAGGSYYKALLESQQCALAGEANNWLDNMSELEGSEVMR